MAMPLVQWHIWRLEYDQAHRTPHRNKGQGHQGLEGKSHFWHKKNTLRFTEVLGKLACRVCSKILGIGSAERAWGDVKHLKTNKRSHLSAKKVKMQATIFGSCSSERASLCHSLKATGKNQLDVEDTWRDDDFDVLGLSKYGVAILDVAPKKKKKYF